MGWTSQFFTTIIIEGNTPQTGIFIYNGTPSLGTLIGSWTTTAGVDAFGNPYPAGINVTQGNLQGVGITNAQITVTNILASVIANSTLNNNTISAGTINETTIIFDAGGGELFGYTSTTNTVNFLTGGDFNWTSPTDGTASVSNIAAGAGGDGGNTSEGGNAGGGGEYAGEPNYPVVNGQVYPGHVGNGGAGNSTSGGHGQDGEDTTFDTGGTAGGVFANGGSGNGAGGTGSTNSVHHDGGNGGAASGFTGGASGGNSGNATAKGNNGLASTSSTHAGAPAAQTGSGRGGAGGDNLGNGANGGAQGGGGGGAGAGGTAPTQKSISYAPLWNGSYYGPDANGSVANKLRSTGTMYQGGETASGGAFNGNQRSVFGLNRTLIASDFAGYTITGCQIQLKCLHSWYNSGMIASLDEYQGLPGSVPGSFPAGYRSSDAALNISADGQSHLFDLSTSIAQRFVTGSSNGLGLGESLAANHPYNLSYYGYFDPGQTRFKITGTIGGSGLTTAGNGFDGSVIITYATASVLEMALSPVAGTDGKGNAFAAGYTGPVSVFDPVTPTQVETWHNFGTPTGVTSFTGVKRYQLMPGNAVRVYIEGTFVNGVNATAVFPAIPSQYWPVNTVNVCCIVANSPARAQLNSSGVLAIILAPTNAACSFSQDFPLD